MSRQSNAPALDRPHGAVATFAILGPGRRESLTEIAGDQLGRIMLVHLDELLLIHDLIRRL